MKAEEQLLLRLGMHVNTEVMQIIKIRVSCKQLEAKQMDCGVRHWKQQRPTLDAEVSGVQRQQHTNPPAVRGSSALNPTYMHANILIACKEEIAYIASIRLMESKRGRTCIGVDR